MSKPKPRLVLAICAVFLLFLAFGWPEATDNACPTNGWARDECVRFGEFRYADKLLLIPNTEPNNFRWQGRLNYDPTRKVLSSPNLGFYWRSGKAAGRKGGDWPVWANDLILFKLSYLVDDAEQLDAFSVMWRRPVPAKTAIKLPIKTPPGLSFYVDKNSEFVLSNNESLLFSDATNSIFLSCPSINNFNSKLSSGKRMCDGVYYLKPGLRIDFSLTVSVLNEWPAAIAALSKLINSWDSQNAK